jgi:hypothetical protein
VHEAELEEETHSDEYNKLSEALQKMKSGAR